MGQPVKHGQTSMKSVNLDVKKLTDTFIQFKNKFSLQGAPSPNIYGPTMSGNQSKDVPISSKTASKPETKDAVTQSNPSNDVAAVAETQPNSIAKTLPKVMQFSRSQTVK